MLILLSLYLGWEIYWDLKVGLLFIKWHTHVMLFLLPMLAIISIFSLQKVKPNSTSVISILVLFSLFVWETYLTISGTMKTPEEKKFNLYIAHQASQTGKSAYYNIDLPFSYKKMKTEEFIFERKSNSLGYSDQEPTPRKSKQEIRILSLGDSFTEGDGTDFDYSYVSNLRRDHSYLPDSTPVTYVNAGKCGSDPFFGFKNYQDILASLDFNIVIQTLSTHDIENDIILRGGMERFQPNHRLQLRPNNKFLEHLYALSYVFRIFYLPFTDLNLLLSKLSLQEAIEKTIQLIPAYQRECESHHATFVLVLLPGKMEVVEDYPEFFKKLILELQKNKSLQIIDLRTQYRKKIIQDKQKFLKDYWWEIDWHHTTKGYQLMADGIWNGLNENKLIIQHNSANKH
ncbi:MAG: SGNH/GDSL hydrolase family protein [Bacteroidia bacterium]|nr:SGNH/GDSL hydrolase family protein [Bacteroidia bacterium]